MQRVFRGLLLLSVLNCSSCRLPYSNASDVVKYKIEKEGAATQGNKSDYSFDHTSSFSRTQKYKIAVLTDGKKFPHYLIANVKLSIGKKVESDSKMQMIPVTDGSAFYDCSNYYIDIKTDQVNSTDDPVCEIIPVGYIKMDGDASSLTTK